jgi:hypothetical protein
MPSGQKQLGWRATELPELPELTILTWQRASIPHGFGLHASNKKNKITTILKRCTTTRNTTIFLQR